MMIHLNAADCTNRLYNIQALVATCQLECWMWKTYAQNYGGEGKQLKEELVPRCIFHAYLTTICQDRNLVYSTISMSLTLPSGSKALQNNAILHWSHSTLLYTKTNFNLCLTIFGLGVWHSAVTCKQRSILVAIPEGNVRAQSQGLWKLELILGIRKLLISPVFPLSSSSF